MIFVLTFLNFAFGTHSNGICLDSRHLVLGLRVQSTSVYNDSTSTLGRYRSHLDFFTANERH